MKICNPAKLYLGISILFLLIGFISKSISVYALLLKAFFVLLWVYVLSILCKKGMKELAWAFVLLPFVAMGSTLIYGGVGHKEGLAVHKNYIHLAGRNFNDILNSKNKKDNTEIKKKVICYAYSKRKDITDILNSSPNKALGSEHNVLIDFNNNVIKQAKRYFKEKTKKNITEQNKKNIQGILKEMRKYCPDFPNSDVVVNT